MSLLGRLRRRAITATTPDRRAYWMRAYLRNKARAGLWDPRFLIGWDGRHFPDPRDRRARRFIMRGYAAGLRVTSTTGGKHAPGSYHYSGRAADMAGGLQAMLRFQRWEARYRHGHYLELFGPDRHACVKNFRHLTLAQGSQLEVLHRNHVHGVWS